MNLAQLSEQALCNLEILQDENFVPEVLKWLKDSSIANHKAAWESVLKFRKETGKYPGHEFLKGIITDLADLNDSKFTVDHALSFLSELRKESITLRVSDHLQKGELDMVEKIVRQRVPTKDKDNFSVDNVSSAYEEMLTRPSGILTGVAELDEVMKGMSYGTVTTIGGGPGSFKTTFALSIAYNAAVKSKMHVAFLSFELMKRDIWFNLMARHSLEMGQKISAELIKKGLLSDEQKGVLAEVQVDFKKVCPGRISVLSPTDFNSMMPADLDAGFEALDNEMPLDAVFLDYIQLTSFYRPKGVDQTEFWNDMVRYFQQFSKNFRKRGAITVLLSQVNRQGEIRMRKRRKATLDMLAEINALDRDSHAAVILFADETMRLNNNFLAQVVKNRSGRVMDEMVSVFVDPEAYLVGASEFSGLFSADSSKLLQSESGDNMFF